MDMVKHSFRGTFLFTYGLIVLATVFHLITKNFKRKAEDCKTSNNNNLEEGKNKSIETPKQNNGMILIIFEIAKGLS